MIINWIACAAEPDIEFNREAAVDNRERTHPDRPQPASEHKET